MTEHLRDALKSKSTVSLNTMSDEEIARVLKDLTETLYLISKIEILKRKIQQLNRSLFKVSRHGWYIIVRALMDLVTNSHSRDDENRTAITYAALGGDFNTFRFLLEEALYPNLMDRAESCLPISYASEKRFLSYCAKALK